MKKLLFIPGLICMLALAAEAQSITVQAPNGGEELITGKVFDIAWIAQGTTKPFKITLWKNGALVGVIRAAEPAGNGNRSICWTVGHLESGGPAGSGEGYTIKIKEKDKPVADTSDQTFKIIISISTNMPKASMHAVALLKPDLKMSITPNPPSPGVGEKTAVRFRVDNIGGGPAPATEMQVRMATTVTDTWPVPSLSPGKHYSLDKKLKPAGVGYILWTGVVDPDGKIVDLDPTNNSATYKMTVRGPDLYISNVRSPDRRQILLQKCILDIWVTNGGTVNSGPFELDADLDTCPGIAHGRDYRTHPGLAPGETVKFRFTHRYKCYGNKWIDIWVDKANKVPEENESNNQSGYSFNISGGNIIN